MWCNLVSRLGTFLNPSGWTGFQDAATIPASNLPLEFTPQRTPDFPPLYVLLQRQGAPYPVIVEGADVSHARHVLEGELHRELENFLSSTTPFNAVPWIAIVRSLDGTPEGMSLSWLTGRGEGVSMKCERDRKRILEGEDTIQNVGLALLVAKLRWMKRRGYWHPRFEILRNYDPGVMDSYLRKCGLSSFSPFALDVASVTGAEGEAILRGSPLQVREIV